MFASRECSGESVLLYTSLLNDEISTKHHIQANWHSALSEGTNCNFSVHGQTANHIIHFGEGSKLVKK